MAEHDEYQALIEASVDGGWRWRIVNSEHRTVSKAGLPEPMRKRDALRGETWTRWGARREAQRALKNLRRYVSRNDPEVIS